MTTIYTVNNKVLKNSANDKWLTKKEATPAPIVLPARTIRYKLADGTILTTSTSGYSVTQVSASPNIWDVNIPADWGANVPLLGSGWAKIQCAPANILEIIAANLEGIDDITNMFSRNSGITAIGQIYNITATKCNNTFYELTNVESGILTVYNQLVSLGAQITSHNNTFYNCGRDTVTGAAELAQIPSSWGGTGA